jgi:hypothetical protein
MLWLLIYSLEMPHWMRPCFVGMETVPTAFAYQIDLFAK